MQRVLDGEATVAERTALEARLAADAAARARFEELSTTHRLLGEVALEAPPEGLHDAVMAEIMRAGAPARYERAPIPPLAGTARPPRGSWFMGRRGVFAGLAAMLAVLVAGGAVWMRLRGATPLANGSGERALVGSIGVPPGSEPLRLGAEGVVARWERTTGGFTLQLSATAAAVRVESWPLTPGVVLIAPDGSPAIAGRLRPLEPGTTIAFVGHAATSNVRIHIRVTPRQGAAKEYDLTLAGPVSGDTHSSAPNEPTSRSSPGH